jgi:hypothetical protein
MANDCRSDCSPSLLQSCEFPVQFRSFSSLETGLPNTTPCRRLPSSISLSLLLFGIVLVTSDHVGGVVGPA